MARPTKREKRDQQLNLKLTFRERSWLLARASASGLRPVDYARAQLLADRPVRGKQIGGGHLDPLFMAQVSRLGNNLNQIARRLHQRDISAPADLEPLLSAIRELIRRGAADGA